MNSENKHDPKEMLVRATQGLAELDTLLRRAEQVERGHKKAEVPQGMGGYRKAAAAEPSPPEKEAGVTAAKGGNSYLLLLDGRLSVDAVWRLHRPPGRYVFHPRHPNYYSSDSDYAIAGSTKPIEVPSYGAHNREEKHIDSEGGHRKESRLIGH